VEAGLPYDQKGRLSERSEFPPFPQGRPASKAISVQVLIFWFFCIKTKEQVAHNFSPFSIVKKAARLLTQPAASLSMSYT